MQIVVSEHLLPTLPDRLSARRGALIVADPSTYEAIGEVTIRALTETLGARLHMLPASSKASMENAHTITQALADHPCAIAIGSGSVNDLVKYAAHRKAIPYDIIATAPSMNGYNSPTASLIEQGHKHSFPATAAAGVYADIGVLAAAPLRMISAGIGDTLCRSTVEADWRLAHVKGKAEYDDSIMEPVRHAEQELMKHIAQTKERDPGLIYVLWNALIAGGEAMHIHGSSMPASQGEHMIAHAMESQIGTQGTLHGEEIAVTTLTMARLQETILPLLGTDAEWVGEHMHSAETLEHALREAGCPVTPEALGWEKVAYVMTVNNSWRTRDRYGFLAFAAQQDITVQA